MPRRRRFCDTKETWAFREADRRETLAEALGQNGHWASVPLEDIVAAVKQEAIGGTSWVLITGGEPATQQLRPLVAALHGAGFAVALETSGTREGHLQPKGEPEDDGGADHVTVSPKLGNPGRQPILRRVVAAAARRGLSVAGELAAGDPGLALDAQAAVLRLADGAAIGMSASAAGALQPLKSCTSVLGVGVDLPATPWSRCDHCPSAPRCAIARRSKESAA